MRSKLVLVAQISDSAIEALFDFVETRHNEKIGIIKDIFSAANGGLDSGVGVAATEVRTVLGAHLLLVALPGAPEH